MVESKDINTNLKHHNVKYLKNLYRNSHEQWDRYFRGIVMITLEATHLESQLLPLPVP